MGEIIFNILLELKNIEQKNPLPLKGAQFIFNLFQSLSSHLNPPLLCIIAFEKVLVINGNCYFLHSFVWLENDVEFFDLCQ